MQYSIARRRRVSLVLVLVASVLSCNLLIQENLFAKAFVDQSLENWASESHEETKGLVGSASTKNVVVYFKPQAFQDRTGLGRMQAIKVEQTYQNSFLKNQMLALRNKLSAVAQKYKMLWASNATVLQISKADLVILSFHPYVDSILEDQMISLEEPFIADSKPITTYDQSNETYGLQVIKATEAWNAGYFGENVVVGVLDTGVDENHPDLQGKILATKNFSSDTDNKDYHGHGTHVSGTIAGGNASGTQIGVAPKAKIIMGKVLGKDGRGNLSALLQGMEWMLNPDGDDQTKDAPRVVSNSWGASSQFIYAFRTIIQTWRRFEIFPNFAAGNSGSNRFSIGAPASYPYSFAVGAIDDRMDVTSFSSRGPTVWWKGMLPRFFVKPDISAPGWKVKSTLPDGKYAEYSGTSMATPHVAGVIALILSMNPELTVDQIIQILSASGLDRGTAGKDNAFGNGIIQVDRVIEKVKALEKKNSWQNSNSIHNESMHSYFRDRDPSQWEWDSL